ncbi:hypothetical protein BaRGS_00007707, partial [Batillaria attramentaria]
KWRNTPRQNSVRRTTGYGTARATASARTPASCLLFYSPRLHRSGAAADDFGWDCQSQRSTPSYTVVPAAAEDDCGAAAQMR